MTILALALAGCRAAAEAPPPSTLASCRPADAAAPGSGDWLFTVDEVLPRFEIAVSPEAQAQLVRLGEYIECDAANELRPEDPVDCGEKPDPARARVTVTRGGVTRAVVEDVAVTLRGKPGSSFQPVTSKPYLKLVFDGFVEGRTLDGLHALRLYNQWEDPSQVARYLGYKIWRGAADEVPLRAGSYPAPRAGFASVEWRVGDDPPIDLGLYGTNEEIDADFLAQWPELSGVTQLYEGEYGTDLTSAKRGDLGLVCADEDDPQPLDDVVRSVDSGSLDKLDQDRFLEYWALEIAVGAREGYATALNNYYVAIDDAGMAVILPIGFDQVLYDEVPLESTDAVLTRDLAERLAPVLRRQLADIDWEGAVLDELRRVSALVQVPEGDLTIPNAYHQTEADFARRNLEWYVRRIRAHLTLDLDDGYPR